jgi:hypothetical protein
MFKIVNQSEFQILEMKMITIGKYRIECGCDFSCLFLQKIESCMNFQLLHFCYKFVIPITDHVNILCICKWAV